MRYERTILKAQRAKIRPERADLRPRWPRGGTDGRKDGRKDRRTDVSKFRPVSYRTSALWGRCPKRGEMISEDQNNAKENG